VREGKKKSEGFCTMARARVERVLCYNASSMVYGIQMRTGATEPCWPTSLLEEVLNFDMFSLRI
jgi:hypothetical protein